MIFREITKRFSLPAIAAFFMLVTSSVAWGQVSISTGTTVTQNFDSIGLNATAALPAGYKADKNTAIRTVGTYSAAGTATEQRGGNSLSPTAANGIYNFGAGPATTATDRAVGFLASSSATTSGNLYVQLQNTGTTTITQLNITYNVEKYRNGSNASGFRMQLYTSINDVTYTPATGFTTAFAPDTDNSGFTTAPGTTVPAGGSLAVFIPANGFYYLAFNYSVTTGTITSNAQALAIDDISITGAISSAASVEVGGRVLEGNGRGVFRARVTMSDPQGNVRTAYTNSFGYYHFSDVQAGENYIFTATHLRYQFGQPTQVQFIGEDNDEINFTATSRSVFDTPNAPGSNDIQAIEPKRGF